jgi:exopolyphosphatase/guanosine-5'-triphosphate,3'-diphosphate pyrophosphatase
MRVAVIDVGTNSVRILVADGESLREVERDLVITRLGEGVDRTGRLDDAPLARTVDAIGRYVDRARDAGAERVRIIATSAVRDAANRDAFVRAVALRAREEPVILSGDEEAQLGFAGATIDLDAPGPFVVLDIGGGSTELVRGTQHAERFISLDIGSVRLTERHVAHDPPIERELDAIRADADIHIARAAGVIGTGSGTLVGLAGTITTAAAIVLGLERYERARIHRARLSGHDVASTRARLVAMTSPQRRELPVMPPGREDVIVAGLVILERVMDRLGHTEVLVSETDILDGTALSLLRHIEPHAR